MNKADLIIYNCGQILTCSSEKGPKKLASMQNLGIVEDGAIAVKNGRILAVGKNGDIRRDFQAPDEVDAQSQVVAPAFVDCHTHIVYGGNRLNEFELKIKGAAYLEILQNGGGILSTVRQTRETSLPDLISETLTRLDKMLALGVGTCEIKTGYGLDTETELKMLEAIFQLDEQHEIDIVPTFLPAHAVPLSDFKLKISNWSDQAIADHYTNLICTEMLPKAAQLIANRNYTGHTFVDVFCEKNAFNLEQSRKVLETAKSLGFKLKAHVDEFTNLGGARMAIELGAASIDHLDTISDEEIELLAQSETIGVVTPTVNFNFGSKEFADARKLIDSGCAIAVSTDYNPGSAPCPSLPNAMAIACRYQKILPAEAFNAVTINAAFAVGKADTTGSLEIGKQADILIFATKDYREIAYEFGGNLVDRVYKHGRLIKTNQAGSDK